MNQIFDKIVNEIEDVGKKWHTSNLLENIEYNSQFVEKTIKDLPALEGDEKERSIIISAGPSLRKTGALKKIKQSNFKGSLVAIDGSLVACLEEGIIPDYVLTLDPHPTRIVRWFGDKNLEENTKNDDYFTRQDLDVDFRKNAIIKNNRNIEMIDEHAYKMKLIICSSAPKNVLERAKEAGFDLYWWHPLVDNPNDPNSLTRKFYNIKKLPCFNTGGTVGTAAWVFASSILKTKEIGLLGMDLGYYKDTPYEMTQTYYELIKHLNTSENIEECFQEFTFPLNGEKYYTDPTYYWYRRNFLQLLNQAKYSKSFNCTEGGTLFGPDIECQTLLDFLGR